MKKVTDVTNHRRAVAILLAASLGFSVAAANASETPEAYDNITVTQQVSASGAKRLVRKFLTDRGFTVGIGPGAARIRSITRDGDTWVMQVRFSLGGYTMNQKAVLYVDANEALVNEKPPQRRPERVAAQ